MTTESERKKKNKAGSTKDISPMGEYVKQGGNFNFSEHLREELDSIRIEP